jgi:putative transposase
VFLTVSPNQSREAQSGIVSRNRGSQVNAPASWSAAALYSFCIGATCFYFTSSHADSIVRCMPVPKTPWPHAPTHQLSGQGTYFVTASTYQKAHHFRGANRLQVLHRGLLTVTGKFGWQLEAWAVFSNHYHFVAHSPTNIADASSLSDLLSLLHVKTAEWVNKLDAAPGRQVWFNFRETRLTHQRSYLARLNYVHQNAVKHGLVPLACQYPWCSAGWFERTASAAMVKSIHRFKTDRISVADEFEVSADWQVVKKRQRAGAVQDAAANL